ncbi:MAG: transcriptional regulator [Alphaproteobacteria bacterium]|nr:MAG: transcriptional regulator [Alphaproteobacteria bacterium]
MEKEVGTETILKRVDEIDPYERPGCPMTWLMGVLAGKWVFPVLYQLYMAGGPIRFAALQRSIGRITQKELTKTLRVLEREGFVTRTVYAEVPPRVEYAVAGLAESLRGPILALGDWATENRPRRVEEPSMAPSPV